MDIFDIFENWKTGGNNYVLKAASDNRWVGFNKSVIDQLLEKFGNHFNLVMWGTKSENDYYCVPFSIVQHLFIEDHMTKGEKAEEGLARWTATIEDHIFKMHSNMMYSANIENYYGVDTPKIELNYQEIDKTLGVDYSIEDAKANVKIRKGQSPFRKKVLDNFKNKCCISGISESSLLVASHIVPWSANKNYRSDPANGLCLFVEFDAYFDQGYITIDPNYSIRISKRINELSPELQKRLNKLEGVKIIEPVKYIINPEYIKYHNAEIFDNFTLK